MSQPWYGQHGPATAAGHHSQAMALGMHHYRYQHGAPAQTVANGPGYASHRSSPTVSRPPSSASTSSNSSYVASSGGPVPQGHNLAAIHLSQGNPMPMINGPHPSLGHQGLGHQSGIHHHAPAARYPLPPRNGGGHIVVGNQVAMRSHHAVPPPAYAQPLRQLSGGNAPSNREQHHGGIQNPNTQYSTMKAPAPSSIGSAGSNPQMHHPVPYRHHVSQRVHGLPGHVLLENYQHHQYHPQQGHHHYLDVRRNSYPPMPYPPVTDVRQNHEVKYSQYQRPMYELPEPVLDHGSMSRSPSPPPAPPAHHGKASLLSKSANDATPNPPFGFAERKEPSASILNIAAKATQAGSVQLPKAPANSDPNAPIAPAKKNEDDDAASILLQLSGVPSQGSGQETSNDDRPMSTVQTGDPGSCASQSKSGLIKPIEASSSLDDDGTIATAEGADYAPDLTSEPSADSSEHHESDFPAPIPENYPKRLALKYDDTKLNSLHCFLRSELLEIFVVQKSSHKSPTHSPGSSVGRVGLRCVHCAMVQRQKENRDEAPMAVFYPRSISEIYRLVTSWQRCHLRKCRNLPPAVRAQWQSLRENDKSRGKTHYWITSAKEIGLIDCQSRAGGIRFGPNTKGTAAAKDSATAACMANASTTVESVPEDMAELNVTSEKPAVECKPEDATVTSV